jgi:hypothetical protein
VGFQNKYFNVKITPTVNFIIGAASLIPWAVYCLCVNTWDTAYAITLWTWVTNMWWVDLTLTANKQTIFVFQAATASTLQLLNAITQW